MSDTPPSRRPICPRCERPLRTCLCGFVTPTANRIDVLILQHPLEVHQAKGSARLLHLSLARSRLSTGEQFDPVALRRQIEADGHRGLLLYPDTPGLPGPTHPVDNLFPIASEATCPLRLIILDGTWRKSLRMLHLNPVLQSLPRLGLTNVPPRRYGALRKSRREGQLSTLEAGCLALDQLEHEAGRYDPLLTAFESFVDRMARFSVDHGCE
jgi:DTW domain-containing protein YfiP